MTDRDFLEKYAENAKLEELPIAAYVVDKEGLFIECNQCARELLRLGESEFKGQTISIFYADQKRREELCRDADKAAVDNKHVAKQMAEFKIKGQTAYMHVHCRALVHEKRIVGYFGFLVDVTEEERYRHNLPVGVYRLDKDGTIVFMNNAARTMLKYDDDEYYYKEVLNKRNVKKLYAREEDADEANRIIDELDEFIHRKTELVNRDEEPFWTSASAYKLLDRDGNPAGREGVLVDITQEERYRQMMEDVPVAMYEIRLDDSKTQRFQHCNNEFAKLFGYKKPEDVIGKVPPESIPRTKEDKDKYYAKIKECDAKGEPVIDYHLLAKTKDGDPLDLAVYTRPIHKRSKDGVEKGDIIGRVGILLNITERIRLEAEEKRLREQVDIFRFDFGQVLHTYSGAVSTVLLKVDAARNAMAPDPFPTSRYLPAKEAWDILAQPAANLAQALDELISIVDALEISPKLSVDDKEDIRYQQNLLRDQKCNEPNALKRPARVAYIARQALMLLNRFEADALSKKRQGVEQWAREILRICSHISLRRTKEELWEVEPMVRSLREWVTLGIPHDSIKETRRIWNLVEQVEAELFEYAESCGVVVKTRHRNPDALVCVASGHVVRAVRNLLHNAIKYSWRKALRKNAWVTIVSSIEGNYVVLRIRNFGVPIPKDEIDSGRIYESLYRGRMSGDRGRPGSGIGLPDARQVARDHGGDVIIQSKPTRYRSSATYYQQPFLTTATLTLPLYKEQED